MNLGTPVAGRQAAGGQLAAQTLAADKTTKAAPTGVDIQRKDTPVSTIQRRI
jgi:hypothetical protein